MPKKQSVTYDAEYQNRPIMTDEEKKQGCLKPILKKLKEQFDDMTTRHNKVFYMRYDVRFPQEAHIPNDNYLIGAFQADWIKALKRDGLDPHYVMTREQSQAKHQHYHGVLLLDGSKTQNISKHIAIAEAIWQRKLAPFIEEKHESDVPAECRKQRGLIDDCTSDREGQPQENGIMLRRDDPEYEEKINRCFHWASYIAKENTKANIPEGQRQLFASRIRSKQVKK